MPSEKVLGSLGKSPSPYTAPSFSDYTGSAFEEQLEADGDVFWTHL